MWYKSKILVIEDTDKIHTGVGGRERRVDGVRTHAVGGRRRPLALGDRRLEAEREPRTSAERRATEVRASQCLARHAILGQELVQIHVLQPAI